MKKYFAKVIGLLLMFALLAPVQAAFALAPQSAISDKILEPSSQLSVRQRFLQFLELMRGMAVRLEYTMGIKVSTIVLNREGGFVRAYGAGKTIDLSTIPDFAIQWMDQHGVETLRLPITGDYASRVREAIAAANAPAVLRQLTMPPRRTVLKMIGAGVWKTIFPGYPVPEPLVLDLSLVTIPMQLEYAKRPLSRLEELTRKIALDALIGWSGPVEGYNVSETGLTRWASVTEAIFVRKHGKRAPIVGRSAAEKEASHNFWKQARENIQKQERRGTEGPAGLSRDVQQMLASRMESTKDEMQELVGQILSLGEPEDAGWKQAVRDAILYSPRADYLRKPMLKEFNRRHPEFAIPPAVIDLAGSVPLQIASAVMERKNLDQESRDLDYLEYEVLQMASGTMPMDVIQAGGFSEWMAQEELAEGEIWKPTLSDKWQETLQASLGLSVHHEYADHRERDLRNVQDEKWINISKKTLWDLMGRAIAQRGGISWQGMARLRKITQILRSYLQSMADQGNKVAEEKLSDMVRTLDQTMREAELKLEADQEGRGEVARSEDYTVLAKDGRTFDQVYTAYKAEGSLLPSPLEKYGMDAYDPRTYPILTEENSDFIIRLSKMTIQELAIEFRRVAEGGASSGYLRELAEEHPDSDMELLQCLVDRMAGLGVENEKRKEVFTHLIPRQAMLNHIDLKALIEKRLAGGKMSSSDDIKKLLPESARHISVLREITRRWVRPEEFDFQKNAIARIVQRGGKVATVSQHREKILSGSVEPNFWLGGRESIFYRALGIKAELSIQRGENLHTKLRALRDAGALQPQDIVLVSYRDPYKDDLFMRWDDYDRIRLVAGHLEKLLDPTSVTWVETTQTRFAYTALKKNKVPIPFLFEQTLAIEPAFHKHISREGVYLDAGLQRRGLGLYLLEQGRRIFEEYFDGFSISTVVGNLLTAQTFHAFYDADLDDGIKGARVSAYAIDLAVELDLIDHRVAGRLSDEAFNSDWADISRERLTYFLRQKWGGAGVNALARIVAHLERLSGIKGKGWVNNLLLESGVLSVMGKVRKSSPMAYFDDEITKVLDAAA